MQYTANYNLNVPEGTDIVNPLVQDNPNWTAIDTAMYANKLRTIGTATEVTTGTVHALTRADNDIPVFRFVATSDYNTGDTFTVDGVSVTALLPNGTLPKNKAYVINASVLAILDGTRMTLVGIDGNINAADVIYDNTSSGLTATDVNAAIDELKSDLIVREKIIHTLGALGSGVAGFFEKSIAKPGYTPILANCAISRIGSINGKIMINGEVSGNTFYGAYRTFDTISNDDSGVDIEVIYKKA